MILYLINIYTIIMLDFLEKENFSCTIFWHLT